MIKGVQCPECETFVSWRVLYSNKPELAKDSIGRRHQTECPVCKCNFAWMPSRKRSRFTLRMTDRNIIFSIERHGRYARTE